MKCDFVYLTLSHTPMALPVNNTINMPRIVPREMYGNKTQLPTMEFLAYWPHGRSPSIQS